MYRKKMPALSESLLVDIIFHCVFISIECHQDMTLNAVHSDVQAYM